MPLNNPFRSDRTQPRYHRHDNRGPNNPKHQRTYEEELAYSYDHPSKPKDSRKKQTGAAPSKYDYDRDYPESYGDSMMQDYAPPSRKDRRLDEAEIPISFSTQSTLVGADFEDQLPPKKGAPAPITTLNSLKFSSKPPKALRGQPKEWRKYARRSVLQTATKGYREAYDKHKAKKSKGGPEKRSGQDQYLPTEARATLNDAMTYQVASDRPHVVDRKDSYDVADTAPPPPPPHDKSLRPKKATGFDRFRQPKDVDKHSTAPLRRDEISNDPRALKHARALRDYDDASPTKPWKSKGSKRAHDIGLRIQDYRDKARTRKPKNEKRGNPYEFDDGDEDRGDDRRFSFAKKEGAENVREAHGGKTAAADKKSKKPPSKDSKTKSSTNQTKDTANIAGLREQIIANANTLCPWHSEPPKDSRHTSNFDVVLTTTSPTTPQSPSYIAHLIHRGIMHRGLTGQSTIIGQTLPYRSVHQALQRLLDFTAARLAQYRDEEVREGERAVLAALDGRDLWPPPSPRASQALQAGGMEGLEGLDEGFITDAREGAKRMLDLETREVEEKFAELRKDVAAKEGRGGYADLENKKYRPLQRADAHRGKGDRRKH